MSRAGVEHWSRGRIVAFLLAVFAVTLGFALPTAAAASAGGPSPIVLCAAGRADLVVVDGQIRKKAPSETAVSPCAFVLAGQVALPQPPITTPAAPIKPRRAVVVPAMASRPLPPARAPPRPPSTAPPQA